MINIMAQFTMAGKCAVVTGGTSLLGRVITQALLEAGACVWVTTSRRDALTAIENSFEGSDGRLRAAYLNFQESDIRRQLCELRDQIVTCHKRVDVLFNNAAIRAAANAKDDVLHRCIADNAMGLLCATEVFAEHMSLHGGGSIVNIGSTLGSHGPDRSVYRGTNVPGFLPDYSIQKGALINFTRFTASRYGRYGIRCNCISPVGIKTGQTPELFAANYAERIPLGRMADPKDIAGAAVFLASEASAFITGVDFPLDGGYSAL